MNDVDAHISRARDTNQRIHIRPVHVNKSAGLAHNAADLPNIFFEKAKGVGIGQHQSGDVSMRAQLAKVIEIGETFSRRTNCLYRKAR